MSVRKAYAFLCLYLTYCIFTFKMLHLLSGFCFVRFLGFCMISIGVCDDNEVIRRQMNDLLLEYSKLRGETVHVSFFSSSEEVLAYCHDSKAQNTLLDILFLDVEMNGMSGIDCKNLLEKEALVWRICFVTNYQEFIFDSFSTKTIGYLVKPVVTNKLYRVLDIVKKEKNDNRLIQYVSMSGEKVSMKLDEISFFQADGSYTLLHLVNQKEKPIVLAKKIGQFEKELEGTCMIRSHKSYLVNLADVRSVGQQISLGSSDEKIPIGRAYKTNFTNQFNAYMRDSIIRRAI